MLSQTAYPLLRMTKHINESFARKEYVLVVSLDIEKAFDTTWHKGLLYKMINFGFSSQLIKLTNLYLMDREFFVNIDGESSNLRPIVAGVPQGSNLGPIFFNIFYSDVPTSDDTEQEIFADDTTVKVSTKNLETAFELMQNHLDRLSIYFEKWKIKINASKTEFMIFTRRRIPEQLPNLHFAGSPVTRTETLKLLGVTLDFFLHNMPT